MKNALMRGALCAAAAALSAGCASSGGSAIKAAAAYMSPLEGVALVAAGAVAWKLNTMPAWSAEATLRGELWQIDLERSMLTDSGSGGASFAFAQAARDLCHKQGAPRHQTQSFVEYREAMLLGDRHRARGEIRCMAAPTQDEW